jgi:CHAT domain-containing protein
VSKGVTRNGHSSNFSGTLTLICLDLGHLMSLKPTKFVPPLDGYKYLMKFELDKTAIDKIDQAILLYLSAIDKYSQANFVVDKAEAQYKIGGAYFLYATLLTDLNYDIEIIISNLKKSIISFVTSKDYFAKKLKAEIELNLGNSYVKLALFENKYLNLDTAIDCYTESLQVFTSEVFQLEYGQTNIQLGKAYYESGRYEEAYNSFLEAVKTLEKLRSDIINSSGTEEDKQKFSEQWIDSYFGLVDSCLKLAPNIDLSDPVNELNKLERYSCSNNIYYARALEYIERSKAKNLVELLANRYLYPKQEALGNEDFQEICSELDRFRREIPALQRKLEIIASNSSQQETQSNPDYFDIANSLANLRKQQDSLLKRISSFDSTFGYTQTVKSIAFSEIQDLIDTNTVAVEWFITHNSFCVFIVLQKLQFPLVWNYSSEDIIDLNTFLNSYLSSYREEDRDTWIQNFPLRLQQLSNILHLEEILEKLIPDTITEIILIPHHKLHLVPLHALPLMDGSCLLDRFSSGVRYAPSCQLLQQIQQKQTYSLEQLFAIKNPKNDHPPLQFADIELTNILSINLFSHTEVIANEQATREAVITKNVQHIECLHFACHGSFELNSPLESALKLSGTTSEDINLNFIDIFGLSLESCQLVTLSACETGIVDTKSTSDEYIGLPSAFLFAGSTSVVSSLWKANDKATALLMIKFYEILKEQKLLKEIKVALALNQAQLWLRGISRNELKQRLEFFFPNKPATQNKLLRELENKVYNPFYWAAFCVLGS